jgi:hypothetical protein
MRPRKTLAYKGSADSYLGQGAHVLGGTLFLTKPLVYRMVHSGNAYLHQSIFALGQYMGRREDQKVLGASRFADVIEAINANGGGGHLLIAPNPDETNNKSSSALTLAIRRILFRDKRFIAKWRRSVMKWWLRRASA